MTLDTILLVEDLVENLIPKPELTDIKIKYKSPKITIKDGKYIAKESISIWEKVFESKNLLIEFSDTETIWNKVLIGKPLNSNTQFYDENIVFARKNIKPWQQITLHHPKQEDPILFTAPNSFIYFVVQFLTIMIILWATWLIISNLL